LAIAQLKAKVGDPGYTPSLRDVPATVCLLGDGDVAIAKAAERALFRLGPAAIEPALEGAETAPSEVRVGLARLLSRWPEDERALPWLLRALRAPDARVCRAAAIALGKRGLPGKAPKARADIETELVAALDRAVAADAKAEVRAIVGALGRVGSSVAVERIRLLQTDDPELVRLSEKALVVLARDASRSAPSTIDPEAPVPEPVTVLLYCREGLEDFVRAEVRERGGSALRLEAGSPQRGLVRARLVGPMRTMFAVRTMTSYAIELGPDFPRSVSPAEALVRAVTLPATMRLVSGLTRGPVRYRIAWGDGGHKRAEVFSCVREIAARAPSWVNDPIGSSWEVTAHRGVHGTRVSLAPRALVDPRFAYRLRDVPAASHPTIAAALVRAAGPHERDVVWDPFVGSGTELVERARFGPYASLAGTDLDPRALEAARVNLEAAGVRGAALGVADANAFEPSGVTLVLTNPPMGLRVARSPQFVGMLERFVSHVSRVLTPGGRLVWLSPMPARTARWARDAGLLLRDAVKVDMGGFAAELQTLWKDS
jgi:precorrin-6B methylase 2